MARATLRSSLWALALVACTHPAPASDGADDDPAPGDSAIRTVVDYDGDPAIDLGGATAVLEGPLVDELVSGQTYELRLAAGPAGADGSATYELLSYRRLVTLIGTASQTSDGVVVDTMNGHIWHLTGSQAATLLGTPRFEPPAYDPAAMTLRIHAFAEQGVERARVDTWGLQPAYSCLVSPLPVERLSLSNITADHALDLEAWMTYRGLFLVGTGTCVESAGTYTCSLRSWGTVVETWTFTPPTPDQGAFGFTTAATGSTVTERAFDCQVMQAADLQSQSDG